MITNERVLGGFVRKNLEKRGFVEQRETQNLQDFAERSVELQFAFHNRDQHIDADRGPDLSLHRVGARAVEGFDSQVLFDPFEEQFDLPSAFVQLSNRQGRQREVVGQEHEAAVVFEVHEADAAQRIGIRVRRLRTRQQDRLIAAQARGLVDRAVGAAREIEIALGPRHEERRTLRESVQPQKVDVTTVHHVERSGLQRQVVEHRHIVRFSVGNPHKTGDIATQVQQRVQLHGPLAATKSRPRKQAQTQVDRGRVQGVGGILQLHRQRIVTVQLSRASDQNVREVGEDAPVVSPIGIGQRAPRDTPAKSRVIQLGLECPQARLDVAKALAIGQLRKGQTQPLIATREPALPPISPLLRDAPIELVPRHELHELRQHKLPRMHNATLPKLTHVQYSEDFRRASSNRARWSFNVIHQQISSSNNRPNR